MTPPPGGATHPRPHAPTSSPRPAPAPAPPDPALEDALAALTAAHRGVEHLLAARAPADAYAGLTTLGEQLRALTGRAANGRAQAAARLQQADGLSIGELGSRLGVSKARAQQLLQAAARGDATTGIPHLQ